MVDWTTTAFVFPGQGSQAVGMGADLVAQYPTAKALFEQADDLLAAPLSQLCFAGPEEDLNDTYNTQPALYVMGVALLQILAETFGDEMRPAFVAGHSLGEITALTAAGSLDFEAGIKLVRERGRLMREATHRSPGAMAAVLGLETDALAAICAAASEQTGRPLVIANDNCPGQTVISGDKETLALAMPMAQEQGAKKVVELPVSVASHSPLMASITPDFRAVLDNTPFTDPQIPVIGNVTAAPLSTAADIRTELGEQLTSTVRWTESVQYMLGQNIETYIELGPKDVLSGLIRRIDRNAKRTPLNSAESVSAFLSS